MTAAILTQISRLELEFAVFASHLRGATCACVHDCSRASLTGPAFACS